MTGATTVSGALVTGAAQRIGRAIALGLAEDGWHVIVHYHRSADAAAQTVAAIEAMVGPVAAGVFVLAAILAWRYPITRAAHARARTELAARSRSR